MTQRLFFILAFALMAGNAPAQQLTPAQYREDFDALWTTVQENYAYWPEKKTDWACVSERYRARMDSVRSRYDLTIDDAVAPLLLKCLKAADSAARLYACNCWLRGITAMPGSCV